MAEIGEITSEHLGTLLQISRDFALQHGFPNGLRALVFMSGNGQSAGQFGTGVSSHDSTIDISNRPLSAPCRARSASTTSLIAKPLSRCADRPARPTPSGRFCPRTARGR